MAIAAAEAASAPKSRLTAAVAGAKKPIAGAFPAGKDARTPEGGAKRRRPERRRAQVSLCRQRAGDDDEAEAAPVEPQALAGAGRSRPQGDAAAHPCARDCRASRQLFGGERLYSAAVVNIAAITVVLVRMVRELNKLYGVPFERNRAYSLVIGLVGGVMPARLATVVSSAVGACRAGLQSGRARGLIGHRIGLSRRIGRMLIDRLESEAAHERERRAGRGARRWRSIWPIASADDRAAGRSGCTIFRGGWLRRSKPPLATSNI